ncbi:glycosyltransferase family 4 protein [Candidatus Uhrbacteria bacterium]|nr:glycosyltransferase family 4 protein [Candidatus Uhrbacteria bacterium]
MRIAHVSCVAPPEIGGIGRMAAKEVESLKASGIDALLVSLTSHPGFRFGNAGILQDIEFLVRGADIVHLHYPFFGTAERLTTLKRSGKIRKLVLTLHMDAVASGLRGMIFEGYRSFFQRRILDATDRLLVSSSDYARHSSFAPWADRAIELPFGVDEQRFLPPHGSRPPVPGTPFTVLFVGGMDTPHAFKGIPVLLEALGKCSDVHATLVGDGDLRSTYEAHAKERGIADRVRFVGSLREDDLVAAYQTANVLVLPSTSGAEAFGLVALEAQSCGIPVIASDLPGVRTVVSHGEAGLLVPPGDVSALAAAIESLRTDRESARQMGKEGRRRVLERFTWSRHIDGLKKVYTGICGSLS